MTPLQPKTTSVSSRDDAADVDEPSAANTSPIPSIAPDALSPTRPIRVFIVDDHEIVRDGLRSLIDAHPDLVIVGEANSVRLALTRIRTLQEAMPGPSVLPAATPSTGVPGETRGHCCVDIVIMDFSLPGDKGNVATAKIHQYWPHIKVLALSMHEDTSYIRSMLAAGAAGYVLKRSVTEELVCAIRAVARGQVYLDPAASGAVAEALTREMAARKRQRAGGDAPSVGMPLSNREEEVLKRIALGTTNKDVAEQLGLSVKTVETYKFRSMVKLGLENRADIIRFALTQNWLSELL